MEKYWLIQKIRKWVKMDLNLDNLTNKQKDNLIQRLCLYLARRGSNSSALMYAKNGEAINRELELFMQFKDIEIELDTFNY